MAEYLARIIGTEEDRLNCPFYFKIGACRHGDRCSRTHLRPAFSQTLLLPHMYQAPPPPANATLSSKELAKYEEDHFQQFFEDTLEELSKYGCVDECLVVTNLGTHMNGNVYVKFGNEAESEAALNGLRGRSYSGRLLAPEYSPVIDFKEARCGMFEETGCNRGEYCNFIHAKPVNERGMKLQYELYRQRRHHHSRSRSRSRERLLKQREKWRRRLSRKDRHGDGDGSRSRSQDRSRSPSPNDRQRERESDREHGKESESSPVGGNESDKKESRREREKARGGKKETREEQREREREDKAEGEERRAMIDEWNKERAAGGSAPATDLRAAQAALMANETSAAGTSAMQTHTGTSATPVSAMATTPTAPTNSMPR